MTHNQVIIYLKKDFLERFFLFKNILCVDTSISGRGHSSEEKVAAWFELKVNEYVDENLDKLNELRKEIRNSEEIDKKEVEDERLENIDTIDENIDEEG